MTLNTVTDTPTYGVCINGSVYGLNQAIDSQTGHDHSQRCRKYSSSSPGGGYLGVIFAGYVPLASQSPYPIIVYLVANYRPHLSHF